MTRTGRNRGRVGAAMLWISLVATCALFTGAPAAAQDQPMPTPEDQRAAELIREIKEGMKRIDEKLAEAGNTRSGGRDEIETLLHEARRKHRNVIKKIDELIRSVKYSQ